MRVPTSMVAIGLLAGFATVHAQTPSPENPQATTYTVPAGTKVLLSLKSAINTKTAQAGDGVYLVSSFPVVGPGRVMIPEGVYVQGTVDRVVRPGRVKGRAQLDLHFTTMIFPNGQVVAIPGKLNSLPGSDGPKVKDGEGTIEQAGNKGRDAANVLKGAGYGAEGGVIGGAASGNVLKGIGYGSLAGAAAGAVYTLFTRGNDIVIPSGTPLEMVLQRPLVLEQQMASANSTPLTPASQPQPMQKPHPKMVCPPGAIGCN